MVTQLYRAHCVSLHWVHRRIVHAMVTYTGHTVSLYTGYIGGEFMPWLLNYTGHTVSLYTGYIGGEFMPYSYSTIQGTLCLSTLGRRRRVHAI